MISSKFSVLLLAACTVAVSTPAAFAQTSTKGSNPSWSSLRSGVAKATTKTAQRNLAKDVESGKIDTRGTRVNVPNSSIETTGTGKRSPISNSQIRFHNPLGSNFANPTSSRWYQKDGNTQVFRIFPGDENWSSTRVGAGRTEAFVDNPLTTVDTDGKTVTFSARYRVARHNSSRRVMIYQSKGRATNTNSNLQGGLRVPAWGVAMFAETNGDIVLVERAIKFSDNKTIKTGFKVGQSFNLRVTDDGLNYKAYINNQLKASGRWERGNTPTVQRWGAYVQGGTNGILTGNTSQPFIVYVSGARVTKN